MRETELKILEKNLKDCEMHLTRVNYAFNKLSPFTPLSRNGYSQFKEEQISHFDQFLFRFAKLQDTLGNKVFKLVLSLLKEDVRGKSFLDILNKLEQLNILDSKDEWLSLREIRNQLAHEYEDEVETIVKLMNHILSKKNFLEKTFIHINQFCIKKFGVSG